MLEGRKAVCVCVLEGREVVHVLTGEGCWGVCGAYCGGCVRLLEWSVTGECFW